MNGRAFDIEIPIFAVRRGLVPGLTSEISNLIAGLTSIDRRVSLPYTTEDRLNAALLAWIRAMGADRVELRRYPAVRGGMATRFAEECIYAQMRHSSRHILYPNYFLPPQLSGKNEQVSVIIHDCQHRVFPQFFSPRKRAWLDYTFRRSLRRADHIFLISHFEKSQIARFFGEKLADRCRVIHISIDWDRFTRAQPSEQACLWSQRPYLLTVGDQGPHKNTLKIIRSFLRLPNRYSEFRLIVVGTTSPEVAQFVEAGIPHESKSRVILTGYVSDADLGLLYKNASLFLLASSYEGFGMPAVEAMGLAIPALVSNGTSLPEVTLGEANYCSDQAPDQAWADAIAHSLENAKTPAASEAFAERVRSRYAPAKVARTLLEELGLANAD